jgi:hypothetical protein
VVEAITTRGTLEQLVRKQLSVGSKPALVTKLLANWPFAGYVTSNYDDLLARALRGIPDSGAAWTVVGNTQSEIRKLYGDAQRRVWQIHGALDFPPERSQLILTKSDYSRIYAPSSPAVEMFKAILARHRLVFVGFGFGDRYLLDVLAEVAKLTADPSRPVIAIMPDSLPDDDRYKLSQSFNVQVLSYPYTPGHEKVQEYLQLHDYLAWRRAYHLRQPSKPCPSFDEETTGLLLYNELALSDAARVRDDVLLPLLEMKVLAHLSTNPVVETKELANDLRARVAAIRGPYAEVDETSALAQEMSGAVLRLQQSGYVEWLAEGAKLRLTAKGNDLVTKKRADAEQFGDEFSTSILSRVEREAEHLNKAQIARVATTADRFIKESISRRALAVASAIAKTNEDQKQYSIVGLLQHLPDYISTMYSAEEALPLLKVITDILVDPTRSERRYIAVFLQATFSTNLLGCDAATIKTRVQELKRTAFILDASVLVPYFAVASSGHSAAKSLVEKLLALGCNVVTTGDFVRELTSHAMTAKKYYQNDKIQTARNLDRARGGTGKINAFVEGFHRAMARSQTILRQQGMQQYLEKTCRLPLVLGSKDANVEVVNDAIENVGIRVLSPALLDDAGKTLAVVYEKKIRLWRESNASLGHSEQPTAEANATAFVERIRAGAVAGVSCPQSYFVTSTRYVDTLTSDRVVFAPDALLQFAITLSGWSHDELAVLGSNLFSELMERNIVVLTNQQLATIFMPLADLSRERLHDLLARYRTKAIEKFGQEEVDRWSTVSDADLPALAERVHYQLIETMERENQRLRAAKDKQVQVSQLTQEDRNELLRYRSKARDRSAKKINKRDAQKARKKGRSTDGVDTTSKS